MLANRPAKTNPIILDPAVGVSDVFSVFISEET